LNTVRLLFWSAVAYILLLVLVRGAYPSETTSPLYLTGIPLVAIIVVIARDLARKSAIPTAERTIATSTAFRANPVQVLSDQFRLAGRASGSYFEIVVRARLRELLITKVALETGLGNETVRRVLSDPKRGPRLLENVPLYRVLYGPIPSGERARITMISEAIDLIGAWKG
jgi:hypothetical protein